MTQPYNWSEQVEPNSTGWKDCTYAAGLTGMVYAGFTAFKLGTYTVAEREALERSDDQPDETGASLPDLKTAIKRRYGKDRVVNGSSVLPTLLDGRVGLVVQGTPANFPAGHRLRRWQPKFTGGHAIFVYHGSDLKYHWYDPLAPMRHEGDIVTKSEVLTFAKGWGGSIKFLPDEFKVAGLPVVPPVPTPLTRTEAEYQAKVALITSLQGQLLVTNTAVTNLSTQLKLLEGRIASAKSALG
jgi:hypothetical protein